MPHLDDFTHLLDQGDHTVPLGTQHPMIARMPATNGGHGLVGGYGDLSWSHHFHPAIHCCLDFISVDPCPALDCLMFIHDLLEGALYSLIGDFPGGYSTSPGIDGCHGNLAVELRGQQLGNFGQRHAVLITQCIDTASQVAIRRAALSTPACRGNADFDLTAMPFKRIDQVVQERVSHG